MPSETAKLAFTRINIHFVIIWVAGIDARKERTGKRLDGPSNEETGSFNA
jgi:hypothetical protein